MRVHLVHATASDGTSIAWTSQGVGPALVLLPGVPFSDLVAERRIPAVQTAFRGLSARLRIVQYDGRGSGHSQRDVEDVGLDAHLRDLDAVISAAGLRRFALLGFYNSVTHAVAYAARHPEHVNGVVLFGGAARGWEPMSGSGTQALLSLIEHDWDTFVESVAHAWLGWSAGDQGPLAVAWLRTATTPPIARATLRAASAIDVTDELERVRCPVLVLHRRDAPVIPLETSRSLVAGLPQGRLRIIEGSSASLFLEGTDELVTTLFGFIGELDGGQDMGSASDAVDRSMYTGGETAPRGLTVRELEVLVQLAKGETNAEIAASLGISLNTVERHVSNVYRKIGARGRAEAATFAVRQGLL